MNESMILQKQNQIPKENHFKTNFSTFITLLVSIYFNLKCLLLACFMMMEMLKCQGLTHTLMIMRELKQ